MNIIKNIIFGILSIGGIFFLAFFTYFQNTTSNTLSNISLSEQPTGEFLYINEDNTLSKNGSGSTLGVYYISQTDKVFSSSGSIEESVEGNKHIITIKEPGYYLFHITDIGKTYNIQTQWYTVKNIGSGMFVINTKDETKHGIMSLSAILGVELTKNSQNSSKLDLYPHSYINFNPSTASKVKNADLLRLSQIFAIGYSQEPLINGTEINNELLDTISTGDKTTSNIFQKIFDYILYESRINQTAFKNIKRNTTRSFRGQNYMEPFMNFFVNKEKKVSYYYHNIEKNIVDIINGENKNKEEIQKLIDKVYTLKALDNQAFQDIIDKIGLYYKSSLSQIENINIQKHLLQILLESSQTNAYTKEVIESSIYLEKHFFDYDFINSRNLYSSLGTFTQQYINEQNLETFDRESFLFFLEQVIISASGIYDTSIQTFIKLLHDYIEYGDPLNSAESVTTTLYSSYDILDSLQNIIKNNTFEASRDEYGLLIFKSPKNYQLKDVVTIREITQIFFDYFDKNNHVLDINKKTDANLMEMFGEVRKNLEEYIIALENYENYTSIYDSTKTNLINGIGINQGKDDNSLSEQKIKNYLNIFHNIDISNIIVNIHGYNYCQNPEGKEKDITYPYCYNIQNLGIGSKKLSFLFFPFENNKIDNISVSQGGTTNKINGSYQLNSIQKVLDEKIQAADLPQEKYQYDFKNFFILTFNTPFTNNTNNNAGTVDIISIEEDPIIRTFKRNNLLGENGDFNTLKGYLDIQYNDIIVQRENEGGQYEINIIGSPLTTDYQIAGKSKSIQAELSGGYEFSNSHSFKNIQLAFVNTKSRDIKKYLLRGNTIYIRENIGVNNLKSSLEKLFPQLDNIINIDNILTSDFQMSTSDISILYIPSTNTVQISTKYKNTDIIINIVDNNSYYVTISGTRSQRLNSMSAIRSILLSKVR